MPSNKERNALNNKYYNSIKRCTEIMKTTIYNENCEDTDKTISEQIDILNRLLENAVRDGVSLDYVDPDNLNAKPILTELIMALEGLRATMSSTYLTTSSIKKRLEADNYYISCSYFCIWKISKLIAFPQLRIHAQF